MPTTLEVQTELFRKPRWLPSWARRFLGHVLWLANSEASHAGEWKHSFYFVKDTILERYGERLPDCDYQEITHSCRSCYKGIWHRGSWNEDVCWRCGGTGVYRQFWVRLERWKLGNYMFHRPCGRLEEKPETVTITGKVAHAQTGSLGWEAAAWLGLLFRRNLLRAMYHDRWELFSYSRPTPLMCLFRLRWWIRAARKWVSHLCTARCWHCERKLWPWSYSREYCSTTCRDLEIPF